MVDIIDVLEEQNLFLIKQGQDYEEQLEKQRVEQLTSEAQVERDIAGLTQAELQVQDKMTRTMAEKNKLSQLVSGSSNKMLTDPVYQKLSKQIIAIYKMVKPNQPEVNEVPPLTQLAEIEKFLEDCVRFKKAGDSYNPQRMTNLIR